MAFAGIGHALRLNRRQTVAIFTDLTWGNGRAVIVGGGVAPVLAIMGVVAGGMVGIVGFSALDMLGIGPLAGVMSALADPSELALLLAAIGFRTEELSATDVAYHVHPEECVGPRYPNPVRAFGREGASGACPHAGAWGRGIGHVLQRGRPMCGDGG